MKFFSLLVLLTSYFCVTISSSVFANKKDIEIPIEFFLADKPLNEDDFNLLFNHSDEIYKNRKKKKERVAAIFWGLAGAAASIAQAANGEPKEGITNFVATVFNTAAQIAQIEANYTKDPDFAPLKCYLLFDCMINLTEYIYKAITQDVSKDVNLLKFPNLKELSSIAVYAERAAWIAKKILENDFVQMFLKESLDYLQIYLHEKIDDLMEFIREKVLFNDLKELSLI
ncbi:MAG: hypothetical protein ABIF12_03330 [bacterium]